MIGKHLKHSFDVGFHEGVHHPLHSLLSDIKIETHLSMGKVEKRIDAVLGEEVLDNMIRALESEASPLSLRYMGQGI